MNIYLVLHSLRRCDLTNIMFVFDLINGNITIKCPELLTMIGLQTPHKYTRDFDLFSFRFLKLILVIIYFSLQSSILDFFLICLINFLSKMFYYG